MIIIILIVILMISFLLALNSLRKLMNKKEIEDIKAKLSRGKVIYQDSSSSRGSSVSSESSSS